jgi:hypothetical protein
MEYVAVTLMMAVVMTVVKKFVDWRWNAYEKKYGKQD